MIDTLESGDAAVLARHLEDGLCGVIVAGEPGVVTGLPRGRVDLLVRLARRDGSFVVAAMEDATGTALFTANGDGGFRCGSDRPSFAAAVARAGHGEALASALR